jgi:hypothetical protein
MEIKNEIVKQLLARARFNTYLFGRNASGMIKDLADALEAAELRAQKAEEELAVIK